MLLYYFSPCRMLLSPMLHVEFSKCACHPVDFRGLGSLTGTGQRPYIREIMHSALNL